MVHADHDEPSFGIRAPAPGRLDLPNEQEVFAYLDANPDALQRYLRGETSLDTLSFGSIPAVAASENEVQDPPDWLEGLGDPLAGFDPLAESDPESEQAVDMWEQLDNLLADEVAGDNEVSLQAGPEVPLFGIGSLFSDEEGEDDDEDGEDEVEEEDVAVANEVSSQAGPEIPSEENDTTSVDEEEVEEEEVDEEYADLAANDAEDSGAGEPAPVDDDVQPTSSPSNLGLIPYPAPAEMIAASLAAPPTRSWGLWEEDACIRHMMEIKREKQLEGEARFREALRRMRDVDGCTRTGATAVKNFWNRKGRARSLLDERRNKRAPLATSKQGKKARNNGSTTNSTPSPKNQATTATSPSSIKPRKRNSVRQATNARKVNKTKRRQNNEDSSEEEEEAEFSDEEEDESEYFVVESDNEEPEYLRPNRKRKDRDDSDDDQDTYTPDSPAVNAVAKGLRPQKRARTAAAC